MSEGARPPEAEEAAAAGGPPPGWPAAPQSQFSAGKTLHGEPAAFGPAFPTADAFAVPQAGPHADPGVFVPPAVDLGHPAAAFAATAPAPPVAAGVSGTSLVDPPARAGETQMGAMLQPPIEPPPATLPGGDLPVYVPAAAPLVARPAAAGPKSRVPLLVGLLAITVTVTAAGAFFVYRQNAAAASEPEAKVDVPKKKKKKAAAPTSEPAPAPAPAPEPTAEPAVEEPTAEPSAEPAPTTTPSATNTPPKPNPSSTPKPSTSSSSTPKPSTSSSGRPIPGPSASAPTGGGGRPKRLPRLTPGGSGGSGGSKGPIRKLPGGF